MFLGRAMNLNDLRVRATKLFVLITWIHVPVAMLIALIARNPWLAPGIVLFGVAVAATLTSRLLKDGLTLRTLMAIFMTCGPILFVYAGRGHSSGWSGHGDWQIDYHMYFFAIYAMLTAYVDWRPIAVAAALTAVHHLILDLVVPGNVFPEEGLDRVALHAIAVAAECGVLFWIVGAIGSLFKRVDDLMDFVTRETADALRKEQEENSALRRELSLAGSGK